MDPEEALARRSKCEALLPSPEVFTDAEMKAVYYRWVDERNCLVALGYHPDPPPSVETLVASWRTGPWMPTDGVDIDHWTQPEYDRAKAKCTLESFTAEGLPQQ
jgi:hypothetical protein